MEPIVHRAAERGAGEYGWLKTRYSFSFANWYNPERMGFGVLRVINDDWVAPGKGFSPHSHRDMEIITIVTKGAVAHEDSGGGKGVVKAGEVQAMSAGSGVVHAEFNASDTEALELFQIWIEPKTPGGNPAYATKSFGIKVPEGLELLVAPHDASNALTINQDAFIYRARIRKDTPLTYTPKVPGNGVYLFVVEGAVEVSGVALGTRDAGGWRGSESLSLSTDTSASILLFEVPMHSA